MASISCSYFHFHRGTGHTSINQCSMRQRNQKLWEWKLTKVTGDSLKLAQGCTSICWQEHLIITSELNKKDSCAADTLTVHIPPSRCAPTWASTGYSNCPFAAFRWQCYLPHKPKPKADVTSPSTAFPPLAPVSPGRTAHARFKLIASDHFLLKGHTVPVYLNYTTVSMTFCHTVSTVMN